MKSITDSMISPAAYFRSRLSTQIAGLFAIGVAILSVPVILYFCVIFTLSVVDVAFSVLFCTALRVVLDAQCRTIVLGDFSLDHVYVGASAGWRINPCEIISIRSCSRVGTLEFVVVMTCRKVLSPYVVLTLSEREYSLLKACKNVAVHEK